MSKQDQHYYVYIVASRTQVLYCGMTNNIQRRAEEHREAKIPGFTATYRCNRLVWFEQSQYVRNAIDREKQIKRWRRAKKIWLIEQMNPTWADLEHFHFYCEPESVLKCGFSWGKAATGLGYFVYT